MQGIADYRLNQTSRFLCGAAVSTPGGFWRAPASSVAFAKGHLARACPKIAKRQSRGVHNAQPNFRLAPVWHFPVGVSAARVNSRLAIHDKAFCTQGGTTMTNFAR
jgi:hypothetical protein